MGKVSLFCKGFISCSKKKRKRNPPANLFAYCLANFRPVPKQLLLSSSYQGTGERQEQDLHKTIRQALPNSFDGLVKDKIMPQQKRRGIETILFFYKLV